MPITWKNINTPSFADSNTLMQSGGEMLTKGLDRLQKEAEDHQQSRFDAADDLRDYNTQEAINAINGMKTMDGYNAAMDQYTPDALATRNLDVAKVMGEFGQQKTDIRTADKAEFDHNEMLSTRAEKPILAEYNAMVANNQHAEAKAFYEANKDKVRDWSTALNSAEAAQNSDINQAHKLKGQRRTEAGWVKEDVTSGILGDIGSTSSLEGLNELSNGSAYQSALVGGNSNEIAAGLKAHRKYLINTASSEITLGNTIKNQHQSALYEDIGNKINNIFSSQPDGHYNDLMGSIAEVKNSERYAQMTPKTRTLVDQYVTDLTAQLTNIPVPVQNDINRALERLPTMVYGQNKDGEDITYRQQEAQIATDRAQNQKKLNAVPKVYHPNTPPLSEGDIPAAILEDVKISGDIFGSGESNQEDLRNSIKTLKDTLESEYGGEGVTLPNRLIVEAFKAAHLVDVTGDNGEGEYQNDVVLEALGKVVKEWKAANKVILDYGTEATRINTEELKYNDKVKSVSTQISDTKLNEFHFRRRTSQGK